MVLGGEGQTNKPVMGGVWIFSEQHNVAMLDQSPLQSHLGLPVCVLLYL